MLERQIPGYVAIGLVQLGVDSALFIAMTALGIDPLPANVLSRLAGALIGFTANGRFTFSSREREFRPARALPRFATTWVLLTAIGTVAVTTVEHHGSLGLAWLAKPFVDALLAVIGFLLSRHWIYR